MTDYWVLWEVTKIRRLICLARTRTGRQAERKRGREGEREREERKREREKERKQQGHHARSRRRRIVGLPHLLPRLCYHAELIPGEVCVCARIYAYARMNSGAWIDVHNGAYLLTLLISRRSISIQNSCMFVTTSQINTMRHVETNAHNIARQKAVHRSAGAQERGE